MTSEKSDDRSAWRQRMRRGDTPLALASVMKSLCRAMIMSAAQQAGEDGGERQCSVSTGRKKFRKCSQGSSHG